ncbi:MAG: hypothetical protein NTZ32_04115 [Planctomycetales bacterium]|nr:hypothetical protein [Planctomycetales bacterium]
MVRLCTQFRPYHCYRRCCKGFEYRTPLRCYERPWRLMFYFSLTPCGKHSTDARGWNATSFAALAVAGLLLLLPTVAIVWGAVVMARAYLTAERSL